MALVYFTLLILIMISPPPFFHVQTATFSSDNNNIRSGWSCLLEWIPMISSSVVIVCSPSRCVWPLSRFFLDFDDNDFSDFFVSYYKPFLVNEGIVYISFWYLFGVITNWWGFCDNEQWWERGQRNILDKGWIWALSENLIFFSRCILLIQGDKRIFLFYGEGCFLDRTALTRFQYSNGMSHGLQTGHSYSLSLCYP